MNKLSTERAIEALYTVRAYYASLTAGYPKGKDCKGIGDVMCSEIANSCLMAIKALEQEPCEDVISRQAVLDGLASIAKAKAKSDAQKALMGRVMFFTEQLPPVTPQPKTGHWIDMGDFEKCSACNRTHLKEIYGKGIWVKTKYCPNCGADMRGEDKE